MPSGGRSPAACMGGQWVAGDGQMRGYETVKDYRVPVICTEPLCGAVGHLNRCSCSGERKDAAFSGTSVLPSRFRCAAWAWTFYGPCQRMASGDSPGGRGRREAPEGTGCAGRRAPDPPRGSQHMIGDCQCHGKQSAMTQVKAEAGQEGTTRRNGRKCVLYGEREELHINIVFKVGCPHTGVTIDKAMVRTHKENTPASTRGKTTIERKGETLTPARRHPRRPLLAGAARGS